MKKMEKSLAELYAIDLLGVLIMERAVLYEAGPFLWRFGPD